MTSDRAGRDTALAAARHLAERCAAIIGTDTRSVILHGSLSAGDYRPGRSDLDLLIISDAGVRADRLGALVERVRGADTGGATGIDLHVVTTAVAAVPSPAPPLALHIGRYDGSSIGVEVEQDVAAAPDLPTELSMARADGHALLGSLPRDVLAPIPAAWVRARGRSWLETWLTRTDDAEHAGLMVLTACRIWRFAVEGEHCSKPAAARWALERDPSLLAVRQALRRYADEPTASIGAAQIRQLLETALRASTSSGAYGR